MHRQCYRVVLGVSGELFVSRFQKLENLVYIVTFENWFLQMVIIPAAAAAGETFADCFPLWIVTLLHRVD